MSERERLSNRRAADEIFEDFRKRYPNALVHLVTRVRSDWRDGCEADRADSRRLMSVRGGSPRQVETS